MQKSQTICSQFTLLKATGIIGVIIAVLNIGAAGVFWLLRYPTWLVLVVSIVPVLVFITSIFLLTTRSLAKVLLYLRLITTLVALDFLAGVVLFGSGTLRVGWSPLLLLVLVGFSAQKLYKAGQTTSAYVFAAQPKTMGKAVAGSRTRSIQLLVAAIIAVIIAGLALVYWRMPEYRDGLTGGDATFLAEESARDKARLDYFTTIMDLYYSENNQTFPADIDTLTAFVNTYPTSNQQAYDNVFGGYQEVVEEYNISISPTDDDKTYMMTYTVNGQQKTVKAGYYIAGQK